MSKRFLGNAARDGMTYLYAIIDNAESEDNQFSYIVAFVSLEGI